MLLNRTVPTTQNNQIVGSGKVQKLRASECPLSLGD